MRPGEFSARPGPSAEGGWEEMAGLGAELQACEVGRRLRAFSLEPSGDGDYPTMHDHSLLSIHCFIHLFNIYPSSAVCRKYFPLKSSHQI